MKKIITTIFSISIFASMLFSSFTNANVYAQTLGDLKKDLANQEQALRDNKTQQKLTEQEMNSINNKITTIQANIKKTYRDIDNLTAEIEALNNSIKEKEKQIKEIINFSQISSGDSAYLEYIFNADDFTDFIYRSAVAEQLADYNDKLIVEFNQSIEDNKKKQKEIEEKRVELNKQQIELEEQYKKLNEDLKKFGDVEVSIEEEIKSLKEVIQTYVDRGCKDHENIKTCGNAILPPNTKFYRPLEKGYVTSEFSYNRKGTYSGFHSGIDISVSPNTNVKVFSSGSGMVAVVGKFNCGGNYVIIHHKMTNGDTYSTMYMHLAKVLVKKGDNVTKQTVVGIMGGGKNPKTPSNYTPNDTCTTGAHNHFSIAPGLYGVDYNWSGFMARVFNPRKIVNFPNGRYNWWSDRITAFN